MATAFVAIGFTNYKHKHLNFWCCLFLSCCSGISCNCFSFGTGTTIQYVDFTGLLEDDFWKFTFGYQIYNTLNLLECCWSVRFLSDVDLTLELNTYFRGAQAHRFEVR